MPVVACQGSIRLVQQEFRREGFCLLGGGWLCGWRRVNLAMAATTWWDSDNLKAVARSTIGVLGVECSPDRQPAGRLAGLGKTGGAARRVTFAFVPLDIAQNLRGPAWVCLRPGAARSGRVVHFAV